MNDASTIDNPGRPPTLPGMKVVGRRHYSNFGTLEDAMAIQQLAIAAAKGKPFMPRGVYRFHSHEDADRWARQMMARPATR